MVGGGQVTAGDGASARSGRACTAVTGQAARFGVRRFPALGWRRALRRGLVGMPPSAALRVRRVQVPAACARRLCVRSRLLTDA